MRVTLICTIHGRAQNLKQVYLFSSCCNRAGAAAAAVAASNIWDQIWKLIVLCYTILYPLPGPRLSIKVINHHQDATWDQETHSFFLKLMCLISIAIALSFVVVLVIWENQNLDKETIPFALYLWPDTYTYVPTQFISLPLLAFQPDFTASLWNLIAKKTCCDILPVPICLFQYANLVMKSSLFNILTRLFGDWRWEIN